MTIKVVKIGGNVVDSPELLDSFVRDFAALPGKKVLIHGGGAIASSIQKSMGILPKMIEGRRVTDEDTLKIVTMVYAGWCSKNIVAKLQAQGCNALGLCGADCNVIRADRRKPVMVESLGTEVDYGHVGDVKAESVDSRLIMSFLDKGITPVFNAINHDGKGELLNTNADTIASSVAVALAQNGSNEVELIYCFEKNGVLYDKNDQTSVISSINTEDFNRLKSEGIIADGMIPKLTNSFNAINAGVSKVMIKHASNLSDDTGTTLRK